MLQSTARKIHKVKCYTKSKFYRFLLKMKILFFIFLLFLSKTTLFHYPLFKFWDMVSLKQWSYGCIKHAHLNSL
ncbi:hypothetical protein AAV98_11965 [Bacillus sp. CHD6a]|nr:hypothetical protein AAV98_11965 [Bacillus sp. CHD6a]